jgi:hypothetical protein
VVLAVQAEVVEEVLLERQIRVVAVAADLPQQAAQAAPVSSS